MSGTVETVKFVWTWEHVYYETLQTRPTNNSWRIRLQGYKACKWM